jgi:thiamine-phosphate pyrophosphorylase
MKEMKSPKNPKFFGLYPIIDLEYLSPNDAPKVAGEILKAGEGRINILQLRAKGRPAGEVLKAAKEIRALTLSYNAIFIINDRIDIALMSSADGVHLGLADINITEARRLLGREKIIGLSTHNINEAKEAARLGADYISYGPIFKTRTKLDAHPPGGLDGLSEVSAAFKETRVPITAIGGMTTDIIAATIAAGASMVAVISEILLATDIPAKVRELIKEIGSPAKVR